MGGGRSWWWGSVTGVTGRWTALWAFYIRLHWLTGTAFGQLPHVTVQCFWLLAGALGVMLAGGRSWGLNLHHVIRMSGIDNGARGPTLWVTFPRTSPSLCKRLRLQFIRWMVFKIVSHVKKKYYMPYFSYIVCICVKILREIFKQLSCNFRLRS